MDINILQTEDMSKIRVAFPHPWVEDIEKEMRQGCMVFIIENTAGCLVKKFDGMNTLFYLWTHESFRGQGYARGIAEFVGKKNLPLPTFARYRSDEKNVEKLFKNAGYEVVHNGDDNFVVVAYRKL